MAHYSQPICTRCKKLFINRDLLTAKVINFRPVGSGQIIKSRTTEWLCDPCRDKDPDWNIPSGQAPGSTSPALERVRSAQAIRAGASNGNRTP